MRLLEGWGGTVARARRDGARPRVARVRTSASPIPQGLRKSNREARAATSKRARGTVRRELVVKAATLAGGTARSHAHTLVRVIPTTGRSRLWPDAQDLVRLAQGQFMTAMHA